MNSVHAAITSGPPTAVIGLSLRSNAHATIDAMPDRDRNRHERQQRTDDRAQPDREEQEDEQQREVGQHDAVGFEVLEQTDPDDREARRRERDPFRRVRVLPHVVHERRTLLERRRAGAEHDVEVGLRPRSQSRP